MQLLAVRDDVEILRKMTVNDRPGLLAVQAELEGSRHHSVALHVKDLNVLQTQLLAVRDELGTLREMDLK